MKNRLGTKGKSWFGRALFIGGVGLTLVMLLALGLVHAVSSLSIHQVYDVELADFDIQNHSLDLDEGERLARIGGCIGCHGPSMEGRVFMDEPWLARIVSPDLTRIVHEYSDAELERVIRRGVRRDGKSVWAMPSPMFYHLTDSDLASIIAYLRSHQPGNGPTPEIRMRLLARVGIMLGKFSPLAGEIPADNRLIPNRGDPDSVGRYLALIACTECHGQDFGGGFEGLAPDLRMTAAYPLPDFVHLMREGVALGERELGLMGEVARGRFAHFSDDEIEALHGYLTSLD